MAPKKKQVEEEQTLAFEMFQKKTAAEKEKKEKKNDEEKEDVRSKEKEEKWLDSAKREKEELGKQPKEGEVDDVAKRNFEKMMLDHLAENPDADADGSDTEKEFNDWVDMQAIKLWQYWALGEWAFSGEENDENKEKLNEFFKNYVKMAPMHETNPPPSDEE